MQVVINIPDLDWSKVKNGSMATANLLNAVRNGTVLPKGHGRIGDLDALRKEISSWGMNDYEPSDFIDEIDMADVIIEADKAESEDKE